MKRNVLLLRKFSVEVLSSSNTNIEINEKIKLYLESGAKEVWICQEGMMSFYDSNGLLPRSKLVSEFPAKVEVEA